MCYHCWPLLLTLSSLLLTCGAFALFCMITWEVFFLHNARKEERSRVVYEYSSVSQPTQWPVTSKHGLVLKAKCSKLSFGVLMWFLQLWVSAHCLKMQRSQSGWTLKFRGEILYISRMPCKAFYTVQLLLRLFLSYLIVRHKTKEKGKRKH